MFRFTIRDMLGLTAMVAVGIAWQVEVAHRDAEHKRELTRQATILRDEIERFKIEAQNARLREAAAIRSSNVSISN